MTFFTITTQMMLSLSISPSLMQNKVFQEFFFFPLLEKGKLSLVVGPEAFKTLKELLLQFVKEHGTLSLVLMEFTNTSNASLIQSGCLFPISLSFLYFITYKEMFSLLLCLAKCALVYRSVQVFLVSGADICGTNLANLNSFQIEIHERHLIIKENIIL